MLTRLIFKQKTNARHRDVESITFIKANTACTVFEPIARKYLSDYKQKQRENHLDKKKKITHNTTHNTTHLLLLHNWSSALINGRIIRVSNLNGYFKKKIPIQIRVNRKKYNYKNSYARK